jgi:hypothetical protein
VFIVEFTGAEFQGIIIRLPWGGRRVVLLFSRDHPDSDEIDATRTFAEETAGL